MSVQYCENGSASRGNILRSRKKSKEHDYVGEFMPLNCSKSVRRLCEDIANVKHLSTFLPLRWVRPPEVGMAERLCLIIPAK